METTNETTTGVVTTSLAETLYTTYCESVGGIAFNGESLKTWTELKALADADTTSREAKVVTAWGKVATTAYDAMGVENVQKAA